MPVLCEAISVLVRRESIDMYYEGGWVKFLEIVPNNTMCTDGDIVRVGFMSPQHVARFVDDLELAGLQFLPRKKFLGFFSASRQQNDIAVVDQKQGPTTPCDWIEFGKFEMGEEKVLLLFAWLLGEKSPYRTANSIQIKDDQLEEFVFPENWSFDKTMYFVSSRDIPSQLQFLRTGDGLDVFWDHEQNKEVYLPR